MGLHTETYHRPGTAPGRLVPIFNPDADISTDALTVSLTKAAAARGDRALLVDCRNGAVMQEAGIIWNVSMGDVLFRDADIHDALYITANEHFTALAAGDAPFDMILGSLAALSLEYEWVFVATDTGCTPVHVRLAGAADISLMPFDTNSDRFMQAYWMIDAIRRRHPKFDPLLLSVGDRKDAVETALLLTGTVGEFLGAPPPYGGHIGDDQFAGRLIDIMYTETRQDKVA